MIDRIRRTDGKTRISNIEQGMKKGKKRRKAPCLLSSSRTSRLRVPSFSCCPSNEERPFLSGDQSMLRCSADR